MYYEDLIDEVLEDLEVVTGVELQEMFPYLMYKAVKGISQYKQQRRAKEIAQNISNTLKNRTQNANNI